MTAITARGHVAHRIEQYAQIRGCWEPSGGEGIRKRKNEGVDSSLIKRMLAAEEESAEHVFVPYIRERNSAGRNS